MGGLSSKDVEMNSMPKNSSRCKMLRFLQLFALALLTTARETAVTSDDQINCGACKGLFDEVDYLVSKGKQHHPAQFSLRFHFLHVTTDYYSQ